MWCFGEGIGWWSWLGGLWMLIVGGGLIALIIWGINRTTRNNNFTSKSSALDIAEKRYAQGEITKDEYEQYRKDLS